jgi:hypothetical protein
LDHWRVSTSAALVPHTHRLKKEKAKKRSSDTSKYDADFSDHQRRDSQKLQLFYFPPPIGEQKKDLKNYLVTSESQSAT